MVIKTKRAVDSSRPVLPAPGRRPRVLVTDGSVRGALSACRSLRRRGYEVEAVESRAWAPAASHWSRACSDHLTAPDPRDDREKFVRALATIAGQGAYEVLVPGSDASLLAISEYRGMLDGVKLGLPRHEVVARCIGKLDLQAAAAKVGFDSPHSIPCEGVGAALRAASAIGYPLVVKPSSSVVTDGRGIRQFGSHLVGSESELRGIVPEMTETVLLQHRADGDVYSLGGVQLGDELVAPVFSRYDRTWPPGAGSASSSETVELPRGLTEQVEKLIAELGWQGIFELEFVSDSKGGFSPIDFNPRLYGTLALAEGAGAPIVAAWCDWLVGVELPAATSRVGVRYRWEEAEARNLLWRLRRHRFQEAASMVLPHRRTTHANFRLSDPAPLLAQAISLVRHHRIQARRAAQETAVSGSR